MRQEKPHEVPISLLACCGRKILSTVQSQQVQEAAPDVGVWAEALDLPSPWVSPLAEEV